MSVELKTWKELCKEKDDRIKELEGKFDLIVERLEEQAQECRKYWEEFDDEDSFGGMNAYCHAVSIVKEVGGIDG